MPEKKRHCSHEVDVAMERQLNMNSVLAGIVFEFTAKITVAILKLIRCLTGGHQPLLASENQRHWATDGEDRILLRSLVLTQYRSVTDGCTDGQTDGYVVVVQHTALAKLVLRRGVKTIYYTCLAVDTQFTLTT